MIIENTGDSSISRQSNGDANYTGGRTANDQDEKKVKDLNREIMTIFQMYKATFGHSSAALLSVLSYLSEYYINQHPESKKTLSPYFENELEKFLKKIKKS
jgi:hypothetical protein